jgi:purine catabolism regulator
MAATAAMRGNLNIIGGGAMDDTVVSVGDVWDIFKPYGIILLAGEKGLDRQVSSVSVLELGSEQQNPAWYLGGELALSTLQMYPDAQSVAKVMRLLSSRNVACLGIHQGTAPSTPDRLIVETAEELGFPLFSIPHSMPYSIIFTGVYERIFSKRINSIIQSEELNTALTQALFARDSVEAIAQTLARLVQKPAAVFDEDCNLLASSPFNSPGKLFIDAIQKGELKPTLLDAEIRELHGSKKQLIRIPIQFESKDYNILMMHTFSDGSAVGRIALLADKWQSAHSEQIDLLGLSHSTTALAIVQMKKRAVLEAEEKIRGDLYSDLLRGAVDSEEYVSVRADQLDIPLHGGHCVIEIISGEESAHHGEASHNRFGDHLRRLIRASYWPHIQRIAVLPQSEGHLIVLHFQQKTHPDVMEAHIRDMHKAVHEQLSGLTGFNCLFMGVGEVQESLMLISRSCIQANRAIALGRKINRSGGLFFFGQMGIYSLVDAKSMDDFHSNCIHELERFAKKCGGNSEIYLDTLEAFFDCGESPTAAASALGIHLNTVRYRLRKISEIMGPSFLSDGKEKLRMYLLIKMQKII